MARLAAAGGIGGGEGIDAGFRPDRRIGEGDAVAGPGWRLTALATPGHTGDHLALRLGGGGRALHRRSRDGLGDDDDLAAGRRSRRLPRQPRAAARGGASAVYYPGHGAPVAEPGRLVAHILAHREAREAEILAALARGPATVAELVAAIYAGVDPALHGAAGRNVLAHLVDLAERGLVAAEGPLAAGARFTVA